VPGRVRHPRRAGGSAPLDGRGLHGRIGISAGLVVTGPVGAKERRHFTAVGNRVNLASRLEGANKVYGTWSLVTDSVARVAARAFLCREIDLVAVRGFSSPCASTSSWARKRRRAPAVELTRVFAEGLAAFRARRWTEATKAFMHLEQEYKDVPSRVFLARIKIYSSRPPGPDWNGVSVLAAK